MKEKEYNISQTLNKQHYKYVFKIREQKREGESVAKFFGHVRSFLQSWKFMDDNS